MVIACLITLLDHKIVEVVNNYLYLLQIIDMSGNKAE